MSNCHELDMTCITFCVLILTFVILLHFYNTSNNPQNNKILLVSNGDKNTSITECFYAVLRSLLRFQHCCLQSAWPSSEEFFQIKFCTETYQDSLRTQPRDSSISLEFGFFFFFFGLIQKQNPDFLWFCPIRGSSPHLQKQCPVFTPSKGHLQHHESNTSLEELACPVHMSSRHFIFSIYATG